MQRTDHFIFKMLDPKQHQATYCLIERSSDSTFVLKALKQKLYIDGLAYLLQDIYGIENKHIQSRVRPSVLHITSKKLQRPEKVLCKWFLVIKPYLWNRRKSKEWKEIEPFGHGNSPKSSDDRIGQVFCLSQRRFDRVSWVGCRADERVGPKGGHR